MGIGGSGMCGIAEVLLTLGYDVSGSDLAASDATRRLERLGSRITIGHRAENVEGAQVLVVSSAVAERNVEVQAARARRIPVIPRAEMLAELMRLKVGIAVAGAHGKTTTTSMIATILAQGGLDPTAVIGGKLNRFGSNARLGQGEWLVAEADESDGSFLRLSPALAVVTNIDREHLDHYGTIDRLREAFLQFINRVPFYGLAIVCLDDEEIRGILPQVRKPFRTYGRTASADVTGREVRPQGWGSLFEVTVFGKSLGSFRLAIPGAHNVTNALGAIAVGLELEIEPEAIRKALAEFGGIERRFQVRGQRRDVIVVDDYGHHPTEIRATIAAARCVHPGRLVVVFQPHRYTRTRDLIADFGPALAEPDLLLLLDIYPAGEDPIPGVTGQALFEQVRAARRGETLFIPNKDDAAERLAERVRHGDLVLTLGAGDVWKIGERLLERL